VSCDVQSLVSPLTLLVCDVVTTRRVLSRATRHIGNYCLQPGDFGLVGAGRGGLHGNLALRSPTNSLVVSRVGVTGTVRGRTSRLLLLLGAVVGTGPRLAAAGGDTLESFDCSGKW